MTDHDGPLGPESREWYSRFMLYLNFGPARTLVKAYQATGRGLKKDRYKVSEAWMKRVNEYRWRERACAYDIAFENERRARHEQARADVWDALHSAALPAAKVVVGFATNRAKFSKSIQQDQLHFKAATEVLDRLGYGRRPPAPMYTAPESTGSDKAPTPAVVLDGLTDEQLASLAAWDDSDD